MCQASLPRKKNLPLSLPIGLILIVLLIAVYLALPQPQLDWDVVVQRASQHVGSTGEVVENGTPLDGIVVVITGATSGIGRGLAETLYGLGATVVAVGRSSSKLGRLQTDLEGLSKDSITSGGDIKEEEHQQQQLRRRLIPIIADLTDLDSVASASDAIRKQFDRIDFLINNAGIHYNGQMYDFLSDLPTTAQGYDQVFGVNYLSHFLLTEKLLPLLSASKNNPRIIQISSSFHWSVDGTDLISPSPHIPPPASRNDTNTFMHKQRSYSNSKLAQILHARWLSRALSKERSPVEVVSVCPGWVGTSIGGKGFNEFILKSLAFPYDGFGLSSTFHAMFQRPVAKKGEKENGKNESEKDYFVNNSLLATLPRAIFVHGGMHRFQRFNRIGFRDLLTWVLALTLLHVQKISYGEFAVNSSPESYDEMIQDGLYKWSKEAVSEWL